MRPTLRTCRKNAPKPPAGDDGVSCSATSPASCLTSPGLSVFFEGHLEDANLDGLLGHDAGHVLDRLLLLPHLGRVGRRQQVQLVPPTLERGGADVDLLASLGGRTASVVLLDGPDPGLLRVVFVSHLGGVLVFSGWVVNTPRKLRSTGPKKRYRPTATSRLSRAFSSVSARRRRTSSTAIPPNLRFHAWKVAGLMLCLAQRTFTAVPARASCRIWSTCSSLNRLVLKGLMLPQETPVINCPTSGVRSRPDQLNHLRRLSNHHSRPLAAINTALTIHSHGNTCSRTRIEGLPDDTVA